MSFKLKLNDALHYLPRWQDLHTQNKNFDVVSSFSYLGIGMLTTLFIYRYLIGVPKDEKGAIRKLGGFPIFTAWTFFTKRHDFIWANFESDPSPHFKFNVLHVKFSFSASVTMVQGADYWQSIQYNVVALRGEEARKAYFDNKDLSFTEGLNAFMGGVRQTMKNDDDLTKVNKRIALLLNRNRLTDGECSYHSISLWLNCLIIIVNY